MGAGQYVVALSADHGVADLPEQNPAGGRQPAQAIRAAIEAAMKPAFGGDGAYIAAISGGDIYFKPGVYERLKADPRDAQGGDRRGEALPGVARVFTSESSPRPPRARRGSPDPAAALSYFRRTQRRHDVLVKEHWMMAASGDHARHAVPVRQARAGHPVRRRHQAGRS